MIVDADAIVLGGATIAMGGLAGWIVREIFRTPAPRPWRPRHVREAMRRDWLVGYARFRSRAVRLGKREWRGVRLAEYESAPLPMVLTGYFEE